jgi:hypothetical protein
MFNLFLHIFLGHNTVHTSLIFVSLIHTFTEFILQCCRSFFFLSYYLSINYGWDGITQFLFLHAFVWFFFGFCTLCCAFSCLDESTARSFVVALYFTELFKLSFWYLLISVSSYSVTILVSISYLLVMHSNLLISGLVNWGF